MGKRSVVRIAPLQCVLPKDRRRTEVQSLHAFELDALTGPCDGSLQYTGQAEGFEMGDEAKECMHLLNQCAKSGYRHRRMLSGVASCRHTQITQSDSKWPAFPACQQSRRGVVGHISFFCGTVRHVQRLVTDTDQVHSP